MIVVFVVDTSPSMGEHIKPQNSNNKMNNNTVTPSTSASTSGMSKLDLAKMTIESIAKMMERRINDHNTRIQLQGHHHVGHHVGYHSGGFGFGFGFCSQDQFLLLSTGRQKSASATCGCGAGGRLLVGFGEYNEKSIESTHTHTQSQSTTNTNTNSNSNSNLHQTQQHHLQQQNQKHEAFEKELKSLNVTTITSKSTSKSTSTSTSSSNTFPEDGGGSNGLNIALSSGLQLLSRYRLHNSYTENFGMGRIPSNQNLVPNNTSHGNNGSGSGSGNSNGTSNSSGSGSMGGTIGGTSIGNTGGTIGSIGGASNSSTNSSPGSLVQAGNALQPACLILVTDGECLRRPKSEGGGSLQLQFNLPLREFYREPFRWDQRMFCLGVGPSSDKLHPSLRAFCDVTGGCHAGIHDVSGIAKITDLLSNLIAPPVPSQWPLSNPLRLPHLPPPLPSSDSTHKCDGRFVNGGPLCCFQQLEATMSGQAPPIHRALLLYTPSSSLDDYKTPKTKTAQFSPPIWCIPESYFPSKKLDTLPPRTAQPVLNFARQYQIVGANTFDPIHVMKSLHRLDQLVMSNRTLIYGSNSKQTQQQQHFLQRDVYLCEWLKHIESRNQQRPKSQRGQEHFPVCIRSAGRPSLSEGDENMLNIGILHLPHNTSSSRPKPSTLTLLPPDPHILLPLLLKAAEVENRALKKAVEKEKVGTMEKAELQHNLHAISKNVLLDENWRSEFRAYLFRVPPYYLLSLRRCLRQLLPARAQTLISTDSVDSIVSQCFSRQCLQKIKSGEQISRDNVDRLERKEEEYRNNMHDVQEGGIEEVGYGQFDKRSQRSNYLNALRQMPPPWKLGTKKRTRIDSTGSQFEGGGGLSPKSVANSIVNLPHECLLAYYDSRRRWIFGGSGLTTRGLAIEGVNNSGSNVHRCNVNRNVLDEPLISLVGVGASSTETHQISKMGEFKGRLLFSRQSIVGYGCNDSSTSATTTAPDGSPNWSMDDDVLPLGFFDSKTGEFSDSMENRFRAKLMINFGNPYKDKRGDSIVPEAFASQRPPLRKNMSEINSIQDSPPHDAFSASVEGEGEAVFVKTSPTHKSFEDDKNEEEENDVGVKRQRLNPSRPPPPPSTNKPPPPPPPTSKQQKRPPPSKPKQGQPPPPPSKPKQGQPPPPSKPKQGQPPPPPSKPKQGQPPPPSTSTAKAQIQPKQNKIRKAATTKEATQASPNVKRVQKPPPAKEEIQSPNVKPKVNLPSGWISVWSKSQRRWYFFDQRTNKSVWEWPPPGGTL